MSALPSPVPLEGKGGVREARLVLSILLVVLSEFVEDREIHPAKALAVVLTPFGKPALEKFTAVELDGFGQVSRILDSECVTRHPPYLCKRTFELSDIHLDPIVQLEIDRVSLGVKRLCMLLETHAPKLYVV
jgi:hypothetical protein